MTSQQILQADLLEILFEKRNKLYGAYQLRKQYPQQLTKALLFSVSSVVLLFLFFKPSDARGKTGPITDSVVITVVDALPPEVKKPEPPAPPPAESKPVKQQTFIDKIVLVKKDNPPVVPTIDALQDAAVSDRTLDGEAVNALQSALTPLRNKGEDLPKPPVDEKKTEVVPDKQPEFPGGMQAWINFLNRHLQAPETLEPGEKRTVVIRFHVAGDGSVTAFQVQQSAGSAFDNEVIRVLKKMPKWTPAIKSGQPVAISFTQPVTFVGMEE